MKYHCISADSHLEIRPDRYAKRVPEKFRDRAPKVITLEDGTLAVLQEGQPLERLISNISCGLPYEERRPFDPLPGENYESSPGTGSPEQRLREQDQDGVDAEVLFPGNVGPGFWRGIRNDDAYKSVVRAYNDWLAEEYCSFSPERLIGVGVIPITNIGDAVAELQHCKRIGLKAVAIDNFPAGNRQPTAGGRSLLGRGGRSTNGADDSRRVRFSAPRPRPAGGGGACIQVRQANRSRTPCAGRDRAIQQIWFSRQ